MDKAPAYGAGDSGFESQYGLIFLSIIIIFFNHFFGTQFFFFYLFIYLSSDYFSSAQS